MRNPLERRYGQGDLHFVTFSCLHRRPLLGDAKSQDCFVRVLDTIRIRHGFRLIGYTGMPEHIHLLISEARIGNPSEALRVLKHNSARALLKREGERVHHGGEHF